MAWSNELSGEQSPQPVETQLHHQKIEIPTDQYLISAEDNIRGNAIKAAVLAEITLPVNNGSGADKKLQLLDFGESIPEQGAVIYHLEGTGDLPGAGRTKNRFALSGVNFVPHDHMVSFIDLPMGSKTVVGREWTNYAGLRLGLNDTNHESAHNKANRTLSREHFTVDIDQTGKITITDHSSNGTKIKSFPVSEQ